LTVQDRDKGILRTDYIKGTEVFRMEKAFSTRYKYNIILFRESEKRTVLNVRCLYEIKEKSGQSFRYANDLFPDEVIVLEKELYRIIEPTLSREEASGTAGPQAGEKEAVSVPGVPAAPKPQETAPGSSPKAQGPPPPAREVTPIPPRPEQTRKAVTPQPKTFFVTKKNTHLREQPSTQAKILLTLKPGRKLEKIGESGNWVRVKIWETTTGWILKDLLQEIPP
ncbi:MAG: SH3 domain-containing protein, partial [Planctomycetaceae bacterium]